MATSRALAVLQDVFDQLSTTPRRLRPDDRIPEDWPLDSLSTEELLLRVANRMGVTLLDDPGLPEVRSLGDLCALLDEQTT